MRWNTNKAGAVMESDQECYLSYLLLKLKVFLLVNFLHYLFADEEDCKSEASGSDASDEDYPCNYDDMDDVRKTVSLLQSIIAERKRKIRSVQQKNRRLIKKIKIARSNIAEYAQKHHINLNAEAEAPHSVCIMVLNYYLIL